MSLAEKTFVDGESVADIVKERKQLRAELSRSIIKYVEHGSNGKPIAVTLRGGTIIRIAKEGRSTWLSIDSN